MEENTSLNIKQKQLNRFKLQKSKYEAKTEKVNLADYEFFEAMQNNMDKQL